MSRACTAAGLSLRELQPAEAAQKAGYGHPNEIPTVEALRQAYQQIAALYSNKG